MATRRKTIADVARRAGVSPGAVSFAVNGRPGVAKPTRERILAAAAELGWSPLHGARALSRSRAFTLGLVVARAPELVGADPFFPTFIAGVETVLVDHGQALLLQVVANSSAEEQGYRRLAREGRVDGVLVVDLRVADPRIALLDEVGLPAITLNRPDVPSPFPSVTLDDRPGLGAAVQHLVELGHHRIAHVSGPSIFLHSRARVQAFQDALAAAGLPGGPVVSGGFTAAGGRAASRELLSGTDRPTAIVYANDAMAISGIAVAHELGIRVPEQLSITGFDDVDLAGYVHPALTTVRADVHGWGELAARTLLALVDGQCVGDAELPPAELIVRHSTTVPSLT